MNPRFISRLFHLALVILAVCAVRGTAAADEGHDLLDLSNLSQHDAVAWLHHNMPSHRVSPRAEWDESRIEGVVIRQTPGPGVVAPGTVIVLYVNLSPRELRTAIVPAVIGQTEVQARRTVAAERLLVRTTGPWLTDGRDIEVVVRGQEPSAGTHVRPGTVVRLDLRWVDRIDPSRAGPDRRVPDVLGMTRADAIWHVNDAGLTPEDRRGVAGTGRLTVRRQIPAAGTWLRRGARVYLGLEYETPTTVEVGPVVPNVLGRHLDNAESLVTRAFLVPVVVRRVGITRDTVVLQSPAAGTRLVRGATVTLTIEIPGDAPTPAPTPSRETRVVPNVIGSAPLDAQRAVEMRMLHVSWVGDHSGPRVTAQTPAAGTVVPVGSTVRLTVAAAAPPPPRTVTVPGVVGLSRSSAVTRLGTSLVPVFTPDVRTGWVVSQSPAAGSVVAAGTTVRMTLR